MRTLTRIVFGVLGVIFFTACGTVAQASSGVIQGKNPYPPQPGDSAMLRQKAGRGFTS